MKKNIAWVLFHVGMRIVVWSAWFDPFEMRNLMDQCFEALGYSLPKKKA